MSHPDSTDWKGLASATERFRRPTEQASIPAD